MIEKFLEVIGLKKVVSDTREYAKKRKDELKKEGRLEEAGYYDQHKTLIYKWRWE